MGWLRDKYKREYFLNEKDGEKTEYGVAGIDSFKKGDLRPLDKLILNNVLFENKRVLDIGFGRGEAILYAYKKNAKVIIGIDFSSEAYDIASEFIFSKKMYKNDKHEFMKRATKIFLINEDILNLCNTNLQKNYFDIILMLDVIEHIPRKEVETIVPLLYSSLNERGIIVINTPFYKVDNDVITEGLKEDAMDTSDLYEETRGMHCNRYTKEGLMEYMENNNFIPFSNKIYGKYNDDVLGALGWDNLRKLGYPVKEKE